MATTTLLERIRAVRLTAAEQRVVDHLLGAPRQAIFSTAGQIAEAAGTSDATVVRTARKLGYDGLPGLRESLTDHVVGVTGPAVLARAAATATPEGVLAQVFADAADRLARTAAAVDARAFEAAVELLVAAEEVVAYGIGPSELLARSLALRLTRAGRRARATGASGFRLADDLMGLRPGTAVVLFLPGRRTVDAEVVLQHARATGASSLLVTDSLQLPADVTLPAAHGTGDLTGETLTAGVLTDALLLAVSARDEQRVVAADQTLTRLRESLTRDRP
ncbi:MurR/RpiR family transcriptional regulator [Pseudonocardia sp. WMMC193]|uniref:MurR/RpiR family transcriptional regulator n=1 Tax=Pseudonocardia sp. WMMC193 TaxID=2911965 RepID=UPI001F16219B|nr:MurR/RpiR family transcriptional regulator [Pseudonocardia sp. WMMC193]MCF7550029.1 MurR/RpiR family transcriptional regulator [Pseudonocardia sp. WMMC193]